MKEQGHRTTTTVMVGEKQRGAKDGKVRPGETSYTNRASRGSSSMDKTIICKDTGKDPTPTPTRCACTYGKAEKSSAGRQASDDGDRIGFGGRSGHGGEFGMWMGIRSKAMEKKEPTMA
jgi:hypothetical protein